MNESVETTLSSVWGELAPRVAQRTQDYWVSIVAPQVTNDDLLTIQVVQPCEPVDVRIEVDL